MNVKQKRPYYNIHPLSETLINTLSVELKKRNIDERLILNWKYIFDDFACKMSPYKILFKGIDKDNLVQKVLYVSTEDRKFASEFLFYKNQFLEKLNQYFGKKKTYFKDIRIKVI